MASGLAPRQEAVPLTWTQLSTDQRQIVRDVHQWLGDLLKNPQPVRSARGGADEEHPSQFLPRLEVRRASNVLMIDGGRGTGKTSVFLSLLQFWTDALTVDGPSAGTATDAIQDEVVSKVLRERNIIPLDILDMQPLSGRPTLLLQLAGRLYRITERLMQARGDQEPAYPRRPEDAAEKSLWRWKDLARAVAIGQEDDPRQRREHSNPEDFTIELEQAERRRMHLSDTWREFIEALRSDVVEYRDRLRPAKPGADPLFIVPIDDADMNPERGVELLELLRSLWHPRVVFLLTGDSGLFRTLLFNHYKKVCPQMPDPMAQNLARDVLGKVIPPAQRLRCQVKRKAAFEYLKPFLPEAITQRVERADLREAFPQRWRVLQDLKQSLEAQQLAPIEVAKVLFEEAVKGSGLRYEEQDHLLQSCFKAARKGKGFRVDENTVAMRPESTQRDELRLDDRRRLSWNVSDGERWFLRRENSGTDESLPDSIVDALYLTSSLAIIPREEGKEEYLNSRVGRSLSVTNHGLIGSIFSFDQLKYEFPWPTPEWYDPIDFRLFLNGWHRALRDVQSRLAGVPGATRASSAQTSAVESLAAWWLSALCMLAMDGVVPDISVEAPTEATWIELGRQVARVTTSAPRWGSNQVQRDMYVLWAKRDALLFSYKLFGLAVHCRDRILEGWIQELMPLISGKTKDQTYWNLVEEAASGFVLEIARAAHRIDEQSVHQQIDCAIRSISNSSWTLWISKDSPGPGPGPGQIDVEKFQLILRDKYGQLSEAQILAASIRAMDPDPVGRLDEGDMHSALLDFVGEDQRNERNRRLAHYKSQLRLILSQIHLSSIPAPLNQFAAGAGRSLWSRAQNVVLISGDVRNMLAELAMRTDILERLDSPKSAQDAWRTIIVSWVIESGATTEAEISNIVEQFLGRTRNSPLELLNLGSLSTHGLSRASDEYKINLRAVTYAAKEVAMLLPANARDSAEYLELLIKHRDMHLDESDNTDQGNIAPLFSDLFTVNYAGREFMMPLVSWPNSVDFLLPIWNLGNEIDWLSKIWMNPFNVEDWVVFCGFLVDMSLGIHAVRKPCNISEYISRIAIQCTERGTAEEFNGQLVKSIVQTIVKANDSQYSGRRSRAVREWVNLAGPLFAAPETGMSAERAASWLRAWDRSPSNTGDPAACKRLSGFRLKRAQLSLGGEATPEKAREFLDGIDERHPEHPWVRQIEALAKGTQSA